MNLKGNKLRGKDIVYNRNNILDIIADNQKLIIETNTKIENANTAMQILALSKTLWRLNDSQCQLKNQAREWGIQC